jgi:hypothetical protein
MAVLEIFLRDQKTLQKFNIKIEKRRYKKAA